MEPMLTTLTNPLDKRLNLKKNNNNSQCNKVSTFAIQSRSPSPLENIPNGHIAPKPNQVSTVVLYGIPIVSLYIEAQERLCLAQISNTLLKQFSYNEIHNRRVALGITCVQCTPVQLEILRRANAMPVSSRRCGMITRREAERLCKSFLGDNSPPRLPDDFSFAVLHECAWGCRGSFLPSRYNSSRAKCIKCTYCGLFFSPNKFIFHSHRVSASDKYIQPDAANFNSWRRHLKLSGSPSDDVQHAWEDVKAMFNGGTRKRLMTSPMSISRNHGSAPPQIMKKLKDAPVKPNAQPQIVPYQSRPVNIPHNYSSNNLPSSQASPVAVNSNAPISSTTPSNVRTPTTFPQELPFSLSRSFMIDYMWHQQQQTSTSVNAPTVANKASHFQFPPYSALSWIKQPPPSFLFKPNNGTSNDEKPSAFNHFHSAFKPVINMRVNDDSNINVGGAPPPNTQSPSSSTSSNYNHTTASSTNQSDDESLTPVKKAMNRKRLLNGKEVEYYVDIDENSHYAEENVQTADESMDGNSNKKDQVTSDDESEMVDIESTEDDVQILNLQPYKATHQNVVSVESKEKIEDVDGKITRLENNGEKQRLEKPPKSPINSLKEIVNRGDYEGEEYYAKRSRTSPSYQEWSLNLKKEPVKYDNPLAPSDYIHKIHAATKIEGRVGTETCPTPNKPNELWSVAKFSLECNNNNTNNNNNNEDSRFSFYQHFNQIQQRNFQHHHIDVSSSASHS